MMPMSENWLLLSWLYIWGAQANNRRNQVADLQLRHICCFMELKVVVKHVEVCPKRGAAFCMHFLMSHELTFENLARFWWGTRPSTVPNIFQPTLPTFHEREGTMNVLPKLRRNCLSSRPQFSLDCVTRSHMTYPNPPSMPNSKK